MKKKILCLHPNIHTVDEFIKYFCLEDSGLADILEWDINHPNYVIATEHIYKNKKVFLDFKRYYGRDDVIYIYQGGEATTPDLNIFDYAINISRELKCLDRVTRIPPNYFYKRYLLSNDLDNEITEDMAHEKWKYLKFCNFIYSNPNSHPMRDRLFREICKYKMVDSLGGHLNNTGIMPTRRNVNWAELSILQKSEYKFTIASENERFEGYTSEKLLTTFQSHSLPIYWGNTHVSDEYNEDAFINCNKYNSIEEVIAKIKEIDEDESLWVKMITAPWQTKEQTMAMTKEYAQYVKLMKKVFGCDISEAKRRPEGTFTNFYIKWFFRTFKPENHFIRDTYKTITRKLRIFFKSALLGKK